MGTLRGERGAVGLGLLALMVPVAALVGVAGFALQRSTVDDAAATVELPDNRYAAPVFACPGGDTAGEVHNGDRVFAIGVHEDDGWLLIRNPIDPTEHWYIEARWVTADAPIEGELPEIGCDDPVPDDAPGDGSEIATPADASTTTTDPDQSTTTTDPESSTTTDGSTTTTEAEGTTTAPTNPSTPTTKPTTPTTKPSTPTTKPSTPTTKPSTPTTQPPPPKPTIGSITTGQTGIWERYPDGYSCGQPSATPVVAHGVANATSVTMSWSGPVPGSRQMNLVNGNWAIAVGSFDTDTLGYGDSATLTLTVTATGPGGSASRSTTITLHDCTFG